MSRASCQGAGGAYHFWLCVRTMYQHAQNWCSEKLSTLCQRLISSGHNLMVFGQLSNYYTYFSTLHQMYSVLTSNSGMNACKL